MKIHSVTLTLYDYGRADERPEKALFVVDDSEDLKEFVKAVYASEGCEILRFDSEEITNVRMSKNVLKSHAKRYFNEN